MKGIPRWLFFFCVLAEVARSFSPTPSFGSTVESQRRWRGRQPSTSSTVPATNDAMKNKSSSKRSWALAASKAATTPKRAPRKKAASSSSPSSSSSSGGGGGTPLKVLPWVARREKERESRRLQHETSQLHREFGISPDATFDEIQLATKVMIKKAGKNMKRKVQIEMAMDRIMQIRLNERILGVGDVKAEARVQSQKEAGEDEEYEEAKKKKKSEDALDLRPEFMKGIIVKPSPAYRKRMIRGWSVMTLVGFFVPILANAEGLLVPIYFGGLNCFRGTDFEAEGYRAMGRKSPLPNSYKFYAYFVSFFLYGVVKALALFGMPVAFRKMQFAYFARYSMENFLLFNINCYMQLYKKPKENKKKKSVYDEDDD